MSRLDPDDIPEMIGDCIARESKLSDWEREFIQSINEQTCKNRSLTEKQEAILDRIWTHVT